MPSIKIWAEADRPREKLMLKGAHHLTDAELVAILLQQGTKEKSAIDLARELLAACKNNVYELSRKSVADLLQMKIKGLGPVKCIMLAAALELGVRKQSSYKQKTKVRSSRDLAGFLQANYAHKKQEVFVVVYLNRANYIMHVETISEGGITGTVVDPRIVMKKALQHDAVSLILCHNHPSGNLQPSQADQSLTQKIKQAALHFDIQLLDHIIVSEEGYYSFADEGAL
jgi:DNA repair protein RadC